MKTNCFRSRAGRLIAFTLFAAHIGVGHAAQVDNLSGDFSNVSNPNGVWSFMFGSSALPHQIALNNGNPLYPAIPAAGYFSSGPNLNSDTPDVFRAAVNGSSAGETNLDFLAGDVVIHSPNVSQPPLRIVWTAPAAGTIDFDTAVWYAHSVVNRSNQVQLFLSSSELGSATVSKASFYDRNHTWSMTGDDVAVAAGDTLTLSFSKTAGQTYGSLNGVSMNVILTPVPEPATGAMMLLGLGLFGCVARRRGVPATH